MCFLIGDENTVEENVEVPDQAFSKVIQKFWVVGERNVMPMTAEVMALKGGWDWETIRGSWEGTRGGM